MTVIRAKCARCGEVDLVPDDVTLTVTRGGDGGSYAFECPECGDLVRKPADRRTVAILMSAGIEPREAADVAPPLADRDAIEPLGEAAYAPSLTLDDLIDFHFLLLDDVYIEECLDQLAASPA
jgi:rRNA maturation protein Nop10